MHWGRMHYCFWVFQWSSKNVTYFWNIFSDTSLQIAFQEVGWTNPILHIETLNRLDYKILLDAPYTYYSL